MGNVRESVTVLAGGSIQNVLTGSEFEFPGGPQRVMIGIVQDIGTGLVESTVQFGTRVIESDAPVSQVVAGSPVLMNEHMYIDEIALGGQRLKITLRETGGATPTPVRVLVKVDDIAA